MPCRKTKETTEENKVRQEERRISRKLKRDEGCDNSKWRDVVRQRIEVRNKQDRRSNETRQKELIIQHDRFEEDRLDRVDNR